VATVRHWSGDQARALRHALRLSVRAFADHLGVAARTVSKWEQHGAAIQPRPDTQAILDTALGRADDEAKRRFDLLLASQEITAAGGNVDDVRRRTLLGLLGPVALGAPLMFRTEPAVQDVDDWEQTVSEYAREVGTMPAMQLLPGLVADFAEIHLRITEASGHVRTRLIRSASQLAALTAIALTNAGERHAAERWWRTAGRAASETSDPELASLVRGRYAVFSFGAAPDERVLGLADSAVELGMGRPCVGVVSGLAARAQTLAQLGRHG
jgi:transcriptional regulator with XRE-family HTH domain